MDFILFAIGLGYLQAGSNQLRRDLCGGVLNQPLYRHSGTALCDRHYGGAADPRWSG